MGVGASGNGGADPTDGVLWGNPTDGGNTEAALEYNYTNAPIQCGDILTINIGAMRFIGYSYIQEISTWDGVNAGSRVVVTNFTATSWALGQYATWYSPPGRDSIPSLRYVCQPADAGKYVIFKFGHGSGWAETTDVSFEVTSVTTPVFLAQPEASLERSVGESATLSVDAAGCGVTYQWKKGGVDIANETNPTLTLAALTTAANGSYTCLASNSSGTTLSSACVLTVAPQLPGGASMTVGINFSRRDGALGGGNAPATWYPSPTAPAYGVHQSRWMTPVGGNASGGPEIVPFGLNGMLNVTWSSANTWSIGDVPTTVSPGNEQVNYGYLDDGGGGLLVTIAGLTNAGFSKYVIRTIAASDNASSFTNLTVTENDTFTTQELTYGPVFPGRVGFGVAAVSSTSSTLTYDSITLSSITGGGTVRGCLTGFIITDKPVMLTQPTAPTNALYTGVAFTIGASDTFGVTPLAYQWQRNGTNIPGATSPSYAVGSATTNDSGNYTLIVTNAHGTVTSGTIAVSVADFFSPVVTTAPQNRSAYVGGKAAFSVVASGGGLSYQWKKGGIAGTDISGATGPTLTLSGLTLADDSDYTVVVMNAVGTNSATAHLTVLPLPAPTTYFGAVLADNPVAYWRLGESAGPTSVDSWGGKDGVYSGTPGYGTAGLITGDANTAVTFSGDDRTEVPFSPDLNNPAGPFTVELWTTPTVSGSQIVYGSQDRSTTRKGFYIGYNFGGFGNRWVCFLGNSANGNVGVPGTTVLQTGVRYHVVVTYDGTTARMYVNGLLEGTLAIPFGVGAGFFEANTSVTARIGARADSATGAYDGVIDDVAVYNYALTQAQVQKHAFLVTPFQVTMTPATGIVVDSKTVGVPHHGQTTTATWAATDGTRSGVMQFNSATPSVIASAANADFNAATNGTICFWIRYNPANPSTGNEAAMIMDRRDAGGSGTGTIIAVNHDGGGDDGTIFFQANPSGANPFSSAHAVNDGNWHFVAVTYGVLAGEMVNIYVDNSTQVTSVPNNLAWGPWPNRQIMLGLSHDGWWKRLDGALDDFRVYTRELTPTEIDSVATTGAVVDANALVVRYDFSAAPVAGQSLNSTPFPGVLQSSPNVLGTYQDVPASLPYLKVLPQTGNEFFRVRTP